MSLFLAQTIGIILVMMGLVLIVRHKELTDVMDGFRANAALRLMAGGISFVVGVFLVATHSEWELGYEVLITLIGWLLVIRGVFFLLFPNGAVEHVLVFLNRPGLFVGGGLVILILGLFLASVGFGLLP